MTINSEDLLNSILASLDRIRFIEPDDVPNIDLYMDQVTTYMDSRLHSTTRYPDDDKILTKTMINNYAKNDLLPPPIKKKYSKEHILILIFIYYFKSILSISDIQRILNPLTEKFFKNGKAYDLQSVYSEVVNIEIEQVENLKAQVKEMYKKSGECFNDAPEEDLDFLHKFAFICILSTDVYVKKLLIEKLVDELYEEAGGEKDTDKTDKKNAKKENKGNTEK